MKEVRLHHIEGQALSLPLPRHHQLLQVQELLQQVLIGPLVDHEPAEQVVAREETGKGRVVVAIVEGGVIEAARLLVIGVKGNVKPECPNQLFLLGLNGQLLVGDPR